MIEGRAVIVTDSSWTAHDYTRVPFDASVSVPLDALKKILDDSVHAARYSHADYPGATFSFLDFLRAACRTMKCTSSVIDAAMEWRSQSILETPKVDNYTFAEYHEYYKRMYGGDDHAAVRKATKVWLEKLGGP